MKSDQINELATALAKAQSEMHGAKKDATNPFYKSAYADLGSVWEACREVLTKNGLSVAQVVDTIPSMQVLVTFLLHSSGQWISSAYPLRPVKDDPQGMGSAISYARRYSLAAMVGIYQTDDDAETAQNRPVIKKAIKSDPATDYFDSLDQHLDPKPSLILNHLPSIPIKRDNEVKGHRHIYKDSIVYPGYEICIVKVGDHPCGDKRLK